MQEKRPVPTPEVVAVDETEVIANLHLSHDKIISGQMPPSEKLLMGVRSDLSKLECYPMYREYAAGNIPTLDVLAQGASRAGAAIEALLNKDKAGGVDEKMLAEEMKAQKLLAGRGDSIRRSVSAYIQTVIRFHNLKRLSHGGSRDNLEQFVKADEARERAHNNLIASLTVLTETAQRAQSEDLLAEHSVIEWIPGMEALSLNEKPGAVVVFSEKMLKDRDYIKDWAIAADFDSQLKDMLAAQAAAEKK